MPANKIVDVLVPADVEPGEDANCYRILQDPEGRGYLIDWLFLDPEEDGNCATVVSRVRISPYLLRTFLSEASEIGTSDMTNLKVRFEGAAG